MNVQLAAKSALEYYNSGNLEKSEQLCKKILKRQDKNHYILNLLGLIYLKRKDYDSAIYYFEKSISINPSYTEAHCNLGLVLMKKGDLDTAMTHFKKAAEINPLMSEAWGNMGSALYQKGLIEDALEYYKKALKLNPTLAENWLNMGTCLIDIGRPREAIQYLQKAIEIKPEYPLAHFNLSFSRLLLGDFKRGWFEYMWRWGLEEFQIPQFPQPLWDGSYLAGKTIYIHGEQGFGDSIQFIRYIPLVVERGGRVIVAVQKVLLQLIKSVEGISELITEGDPLPQFDVHCPLAGLPLAFETNLETIPSKVPYLSVDSGLIKKWGERLHSDKGILKVGLAWAGSQFHKKDLFRSINLEQFAPLAEIGDIVFYSLQKGRGSEQAKNPPKGMKLVDLMDEVQDFSDTAAIIENLDLVISVDTAVAHLAGALGKPVWTLLPFAPDWRWMLGREDSPWYPTMRLFRQPALRDWDSVIRRVVDELRELSKGKTVNIAQEEKVEKELSTDTSSQITSEGDQILMKKETKDAGREDIAIILQCEGMGDCLFAMAVIKKLYIMDGMNSKFILFTHNPHLFQKCPYVEKVYHIHNMAERSKYKKAIILFDTTKLAHWTVDTFNFISIPLGIGELSFREKQLEYFPVEEDKSQHFDVVINTSITWPCRSWPIENWQKVADYILEKGYSVAVVGKDTFSKADNMWKRSYGLKGCVDLTNKLSLDQTYYTIKNSKLFITCQNGLSVLSGATDTEIIVLDMSIEWSKRAIYRNEDPHYKVTYVKGNCQIYCCSSFECPIYGEFRCIPTVEQVLEVVEQKLSVILPNVTAIKKFKPNLKNEKTNLINVSYGKCYICGSITYFQIEDGNSLREAKCPICLGSKRNRDVAKVIIKTFLNDDVISLKEALPLLKDLAIFEAQSTGPIHNCLKELANYICSEYFDDVAPGTLNIDGIRCENLENLTFPDNSFDLVITQDVFEHISDFEKAFLEINRVLKKGGFHIFTVPLHENRKTIKRAKLIDGKPFFILPPVYHGDPLRQSGSLVFTDFGDDILSYLNSLNIPTEIALNNKFYSFNKIPWIYDEASYEVYSNYSKRGEILKYFLYNSVVFRSKKIVDINSGNNNV